MRYVTIPGITPPVSCLGLGAGSFRPDDYERAAGLLDTFVALGGTCVDTAHVYGMGLSERALGRWLHERGNRAEIVLVDKGCHPIPITSLTPRVTPAAIRADLAESLERLDTGYIDLYLLHRDDEQVPVGPIVEALNEEHHHGRIRAFGGSNWRTERIAAANAYAEEHQLVGFAASSPNLSLPRPNEPIVAGCISALGIDRDWHARTGLPLLAWSAQGGGFMSGRWTPEDRSNPMMVRVWYSDDNFARLRRATELGCAKGYSPIQVALAFVLNQPFPVVALVGPGSEKHLRDCYAALDLDLTPAELSYLDGSTDSG